MFKKLNKEVQDLRKTKKSGFSLMELIIVIVIIGILISAVIGLNGQRETAKISAGQQVVLQIMNASQGWAVQNASEDFTNINLANLIGNTLPATFDEKKANPWAGNITVAVQGAAGNQINHYTVSLTNVPAKSCTAIKNALTNKTIIAPTCVAAGGADTLSATF